jgi:hypothetical protein
VFRFTLSGLLFQNLDNITVNKYAKQIPEFYGEVLRSWDKIGGGQTRTPLNFADVGKQIIWGNKLIKFDHKTLLFNNWINSDGQQLHQYQQN